MSFLDVVVVVIHASIKLVVFCLFLLCGIHKIKYDHGGEGVTFDDSDKTLIELTRSTCLRPFSLLLELLELGNMSLGPLFEAHYLTFKSLLQFPQLLILRSNNGGNQTESVPDLRRGKRPA